MLASSLPVKKMKTEYGAVTTLQTSDAGSDFACTKRKDVRRRPKTATPTVDTSTASFLDLNDDCLDKIFNLARVRVFDFYSLSQTCTRFKEIGSGIFQRKVKICDLRRVTDLNAATAIGVLRTIREVISELRLCMNTISYSNSIAILDAASRHCTELKSLTIEGYTVSSAKDDMRKLGLLFTNLEELHLEYIFIEDEALSDNIFINCQSLISLKVVNCYHFKGAIFESSFPNLEHFDYKSGDFDVYDNIEDFISRHPNLKSFRLDTDNNAYLENLAAGCKNLTNLKIRLDTNLHPPHLFPHRTSHSRLGDSVKSLANFEILKELTVECAGHDGATKLVEVLPQLAQSLECLHVEYFSGSLALISAVAQLKNLRIFRLHEHNGTIDISRIGELTQLVELSLIDVEAKNVDLIKMVNNLVHLSLLKFYLNDFEITNELYAQLLDVLKRRQPDGHQQLVMYCRTATDFVREFCQTMVEIKF